MNTNARISTIRPLLAPNWLKRQVPSTKTIEQHVVKKRREIAAIIKGQDPRLLMIVGPCSIHDPIAALDYAKKLASIAQQCEQHLLIVMRCYFEKPRTNLGWKGLINDPLLDESCDINLGLQIARQLLVNINDLGLAVATEFLDTMTPQYLDDLVSWAAIGARTTESQIHRNLASGLSMPVGFKNTTTGHVKPAIDAVIAARHPHQFLGTNSDGLASIVTTSGNDSCHVILRGGSDSGPNFHPEQIANTQSLLGKHAITSKLVIDCSHGNSEKDYQRQANVLQSLQAQMIAGNQHIKGMMLESFLQAGKQDINPLNQLQYGQSITDACIGWDETAHLITQMADTMAQLTPGRVA